MTRTADCSGDISRWAWFVTSQFGSHYHAILNNGSYNYTSLIIIWNEGDGEPGHVAVADGNRARTTHSPLWPAEHDPGVGQTISRAVFVVDGPLPSVVPWSRSTANHVRCKP